jgi:hypothetical protein
VTFSEDGFVIPDFNFDSSDALIPITNPGISMVQFDPIEHFCRLQVAVRNADETEASRHFSFFRASLIQRSKSLPDSLFVDFDVAEFFIGIITESTPTRVLYDAMCALTAWTGVQNRDSDGFACITFINSLFEITITSLSGRTFEGDRRSGRAGIAVFQNLLFNSNDFRVLFIQSGGLVLFCTLYYELTDYGLTQRILWILQNCTLVEPKPETEVFVPILDLLRGVLGPGVQGVESSEIRLCCAFVEMGPQFAHRFLSELEVPSLSYAFCYLAAGTQVMVLDLFGRLTTFPDDSVVALAGKRIHWHEFVPHIPESFDRKVQKRFINVAMSILERHLLTPDGDRYLSIFFPVAFALMEKRLLRVRALAIRLISRILGSGAPSVLELVIGQKVITRSVPFLDSDWTLLQRCALELLLFCVQGALAGKCMRKVLDQVAVSEVVDAVEALCGKEVEPEIGIMADTLKSQIDELLDAKIIESESSDNEENRSAADTRHPYDESEEDQWEDA